MTRGILVYITGEKGNEIFIASSEFNGDMFVDDLGADAIYRLTKVNSIDDFKDTVQKFDADFYNYGDVECKTIDRAILGSYLYDYSYIINRSGHDVEWPDRNGKVFKVKNGDIGVLYFGAGVPRNEWLSEYNNEVERRETTVERKIEKLG